MGGRPCVVSTGLGSSTSSFVVAILIRCCEAFEHSALGGCARSRSVDSNERAKQFNSHNAFG